MQYVRLGTSGLQVSRLCLGMMTYGAKSWRPWVLEEADGAPLIRAAYERGINFFDTADMYSNGVSEEITGRVLRELGARDEMVIATKVFFPWSDRPNTGGLSRKHIFDSIDGSLRRLGLDTVDLYIIHRWDPATRIEETMEALHDVVKSGKARYIGASSMWAWQFAQAQFAASAHGWTPFISMQNHYNLVYREEEREMLPFCRDQGIGITPWSPLARGFLAGNRTLGTAGEKTGATPRAQSDAFAQQLYYAPSDFTVVERVTELAMRRGVAPAQVALSWLLHQPGVTAPIIGVTKLSQLDDACGALDLSLDGEERALLEAPYVAHPVMGHE